MRELLLPLCHLDFFNSMMQVVSGALAASTPTGSPLFVTFCMKKSDSVQVPRWHQALSRCPPLLEAAVPSL